MCAAPKSGHRRGSRRTEALIRGGGGSLKTSSTINAELAFEICSEQSAPRERITRKQELGKGIEGKCP